MSKLWALLKEPFRTQTPIEKISKELAEAHLQKLEAETAVDYAQAIVDYNTVKIRRLNERAKEYI